MKTYTVKPEGINPVRKRVLLFGAGSLLVVLTGIVLILPDITPLSVGIAAVFVVLFGGLGFRRGLRRLEETWPTYTLTVADDYLLKQQAHYPDIWISRNEVKSIRKVFTGEITVKTRDWKKFLVIPPSLIGIEEVVVLLGQWKTIKQVPRGKTLLYYVLPIVIVVLFFAVARGYLKNGAPDPAVIIGAVLVTVVLNVFHMRTLKRIPNLDERSKPKRWRFILMIGYIVLMLLSLVVFFGLKK
jgi:hypothetical protein